MVSTPSLCISIGCSQLLILHPSQQTDKKKHHQCNPAHHARMIMTAKYSQGMFKIDCPSRGRINSFIHRLWEVQIFRNRQGNRGSWKYFSWKVVFSEHRLWQSHAMCCAVVQLSSFLFLLKMWMCEFHGLGKINLRNHRGYVLGVSRRTPHP